MSIVWVVLCIQLSIPLECVVRIFWFYIQTEKYTKNASVDVSHNKFIPQLRPQLNTGVHHNSKETHNQILLVTFFVILFDNISDWTYLGTYFLLYFFFPIFSLSKQYFNCKLIRIRRKIHIRFTSFSIEFET